MREATRPRNGATEHVEEREAEAAQIDAEAALHETALRYKRELDWAKVDAIEVDLAFLRAGRMHRVATARVIEQMNLGVSMTGARFTLLLTLYFARESLMAQNEISRELSVSRTNITNLIDGLERDGLVARVPNPADRRVSYAQLTEAGEEMCRRVLPEITRTMMEEIQGFSQAEIDLFKQFLYRMQHNIIANHPGKYGRGIGVDD